MRDVGDTQDAGCQRKRSAEFEPVGVYERGLDLPEELGPMQGRSKARQRLPPFEPFERINRMGLVQIGQGIRKLTFAGNHYVSFPTRFGQMGQ